MARTAPTSLASIAAFGPLDLLETTELVTMDRNFNHAGRYLAPPVLNQPLAAWNFWLPWETETDVNFVQHNVWRCKRVDSAWVSVSITVEFWARVDSSTAVVRLNAGGTNLDTTIAATNWTRYTAIVPGPAAGTAYADLALSMRTSGATNVDVLSIWARWTVGTSTVPATDDGIIYLDDGKVGADYPVSVYREQMKRNNMVTLMARRTSQLVNYSIDASTTAPNGLFTPPTADGPLFVRESTAWVMDGFPCHLGPLTSSLKIWYRGYGDADFGVKVWLEGSGYATAEADTCPGSATYAASSWRSLDLTIEPRGKDSLAHIFVELSVDPGKWAALGNLSIWEVV